MYMAICGYDDTTINGADASWSHFDANSATFKHASTAVAATVAYGQPARGSA